MPLTDEPVSRETRNLCPIRVNVSRSDLQGDWQSQVQILHDDETHTFAEITMNGDSGYFDVCLNEAYRLKSHTDPLISYIIFEIVCPDAPVTSVIYYPPPTQVPARYNQSSMLNIIDLIELCLQIIRTTVITVVLASRRIAEARRVLLQMRDDSAHGASSVVNSAGLGINVKSILLTENDPNYTAEITSENMCAGNSLDLNHAYADLALKAQNIQSHCLELEEWNKEYESTVKGLRAELEKSRTRCAELEKKNEEHLMKLTELSYQTEKSVTFGKDLEKVNKESTFTNAYLKVELQKSAARCLEMEKKISDDWDCLARLSIELQDSMAACGEKIHIIEGLENSMASLQAELQKSESSNAQMRGIVDDLNSEILQSEKEHASYVEDVEKEKEELMTRISHLEPFEKKLRMYTSRDDNYESSIEELMSEKLTLVERCLELEKKEAHLKYNLDEYTKSSHEMINVIDALESEIRNIKRRSQLEIEDMTSSSQFELEEHARRCIKLHNDVKEAQEENHRLVMQLEECELLLEDKNRELELILAGKTRNTGKLQDNYRSEPLADDKSQQRVCGEACKKLAADLLLTQQKLTETEEKLGVVEYKLTVASNMMVGRVPLSRCQELESNMESIKRDLEDKIASMTSRLAHSEEKNEAIKRDLDLTRWQLQQAKTEADLAERALKNRNTVPNERLKELIHERDEISKQLQTSEEQVKDMRSHVEDYAAQLENCRGQIEDYKTQLATAYAQIEAHYSEIRSNSEDFLKVQVIQYGKDVAALREKLRLSGNKTQEAIEEMNKQRISFRSMEKTYIKKIDELEAALQDKEGKTPRKALHASDAEAISRSDQAR